jgi:hypothetical protein
MKNRSIETLKMLLFPKKAGMHVDKRKKQNKEKCRKRVDRNEHQ